MTYIMSCVWLDYMVKYFQCKNCVGSSPKTKKCVASFLVPGDRKGQISLEICPFQLNPHLRVGEILLRNMKYAFSVLNRCGDGWI